MRAPLVETASGAEPPARLRWALLVPLITNGGPSVPATPPSSPASMNEKSLDRSDALAPTPPPPLLPPTPPPPAAEAPAPASSAHRSTGKRIKAGIGPAPDGARGAPCRAAPLLQARDFAVVDDTGASDAAEAAEVAAGAAARGSAVRSFSSRRILGVCRSGAA
jgi:hypothetical protein